MVFSVDFRLFVSFTSSNLSLCGAFQSLDEQSIKHRLNFGFPGPAIHIFSSFLETVSGRRDSIKTSIKGMKKSEEMLQS